MPRQTEPKKDAAGGDTPGGVVNKRYHSRISEWGNPAVRTTVTLWLNT